MTISPDPWIRLRGKSNTAGHTHEMSDDLSSISYPPSVVFAMNVQKSNLQQSQDYHQSAKPDEGDESDQRNINHLQHW